MRQGRCPEPGSLEVLPTATRQGQCPEPGSLEVLPAAVREALPTAMRQSCLALMAAMVAACLLWQMMPGRDQTFCGRCSNCVAPPPPAWCVRECQHTRAGVPRPGPSEITGRCRFCGALRLLANPCACTAQWRIPRLPCCLRWEPPLGGPERIGYRVESGALFEETLSDYFIAGADWLQKLRVRHEGGSSLFLTVRGYNLYGVGEAARFSVRLLDVPDSPADMRVEPGVTTLRLSFTAPANDGYGRKPVDADYAESAEAMALRLAYRIRLYASGELIEERNIPLGSPLRPVTMEFMELKSAFAYRLEAFAHNTVGTGSPSTLRTVTRFSECADKGLKSALGDGSSYNPWQIATLCQLQDARSDLYAHYVQVADIDARLSRGWSGGAGFHPIEPFSGTFDGAGREISALYINRPVTNTVGLFSRLAEDGITKGGGAR